MARSKNSPALFEVIRNAQQKQREQQERQRRVAENGGVEASPAAALLRSPLYWFKGKHAHDAVHGPTEPVMREVAPPPIKRAVAVETVETEPEIRHEPMIEVATAAHEESVVETTETHIAPPAPAPSAIAAEYARQVREEIAAQDAPAAEAFFDTHPTRTTRDPAASIDSIDDYLAAKPPEEPSQIKLSFSYTTAAVAGLGLIVLLLVVYVVGAAGRSHGTPIASNTIHPDVLNVIPPTPSPDGNLVQTTTDDSQPLARTDATGTSQTLGLETLGKPIPVPTSVKRVVGLQYVVLLSFPRADDANELVKYLADNGVPTTAEKALPGYSPSWYSVVTTRGFDHVRGNPEYDNYVAVLGKLMQKYARGSKFKTFQPDVYKWRGN